MYIIWEFEKAHHINQHVQRTLPLLQQLRRIMLFPLLLLILSKVALEGLLTPGAIDGVGDGRKCRDGLILSWISQKLFSPSHQPPFFLHTTIQKQFPRGTVNIPE
jgi:hypothetical protein